MRPGHHELSLKEEKSSELSFTKHIKINIKLESSSGGIGGSCFWYGILSRSISFFSQHG